MPLIPFLVMDMLEPLATRSRHLLRSQTLAHLRALRFPFETDGELDCAITSDKNKFEISLNVKDFKPTDITVKTIDDNVIVVEGKHEASANGETGYVARHFVRRYVLPDGHDAKDIVSNLSEDGLLTITAPTIKIPPPNERVIPITRTGSSANKEMNDGKTDSVKSN